MWNFKTSKIQRTFQNWSKILCGKKVVAYYERKHKKMYKMNFWLWFEILIIFTYTTLDLQGIRTFSKFIVLKNRLKKIVMYWNNYKHSL